MFAPGIPCIFRSLDGGASWEDITANLPRCGMSAMKVNPHTGELYKGSVIGTWVYPSAYEVNVGEKQSKPNEFRLKQNAPNPFNPETHIEFELPRAGQVRLAVISLTGAPIRTLENAHRNAGRYSIDWDGRDDFGRSAPSGVYFYRLTAGGLMRTGKMTLLR